MNLELLHDLIKNNERLLNYLRDFNHIKKILNCKKYTREMKEENMNDTYLKNVGNAPIANRENFF